MTHIKKEPQNRIKLIQKRKKKEPQIKIEGQPPKKRRKVEKSPLPMPPLEAEGGASPAPKRRRDQSWGRDDEPWENTMPVLKRKKVESKKVKKKKSMPKPKPKPKKSKPKPTKPKPTKAPKDQKRAKRGGLTSWLKPT